MQSRRILISRLTFRFLVIALTVVLPATISTRVAAAELFLSVDHEAPVHSLAVALKGDRFATGAGGFGKKKYETGVFTVWDAQTGRKLSTFSLEGAPTSVGFSPEGNLLVSVSISFLFLADGAGFPASTVVLWDVATGQEVRRWEWPLSVVSCMAVSSDGKWIAVGGINQAPQHKGVGEFKVFSLETGKEVVSIRSPARGGKVDPVNELAGPVVAIEFTPDGRHLLVANAYNRGTIVQVFHLNDWTVTQTAAFHKEPAIFRLAATRAVNQLVLFPWAKDGDIDIYAFDPDKPGKKLKTLEKKGHLGAVSFSGRMAASGSESGEIFIWDIGTGEVIDVIHESQKRISSLTFTADNRAVIAGGSDKTANVWRLKNAPPMVAINQPKPQGKAPLDGSVASSQTALKRAVQLSLSGNYSESIRLFEQGLDEATKSSAADSLQVLDASLALGATYQRVGNHSAAMPLLVRGMKTLEAKNEFHLAAAAASKLAEAQVALGEFREANGTIQHALQLLRQGRNSGRQDPEAPLTQLRLRASLADAMQAAIPRESMQALSPENATFLAQLYDLEIESCVSEIERLSGKNSPLLAPFLVRQGRSKLDRRQYKDANAFATRAVEVSTVRGVNDVALAPPLLLKADATAGLRHFDEALQVYDLLLQIVEPKLGKEHLQSITARFRRALVLEQLGRRKDAQDEIMRVGRQLKTFVVQALPGMTLPQQLAFMEQINTPIVRRALAFGLQQADESPEMVAEWVMNCKANTLESLAEGASLVRGSSDPEARQTADALDDVRRDLAAIASGTAIAAPTRLTTLFEEERELAQKLRRSLGLPLRDGPLWIECEAVRQAIPMGTVLIDVFKAPMAIEAELDIVRPRWLEHCYFATVLTADQPIRVVKLGSANEIEDAVEAFRTSLNSFKAAAGKNGGSVGAGEEALRKLSDAVLKPLLPFAGQSAQWIVSPDAALWLIPWESLPLEGGEYLIEKVSLSYLACSRHVAYTNSLKPSGPALVLADPEYDLSPTDAKEEESRLTKDAIPSPSFSMNDSPSRVPGTLKFGRLPGTAAEAAAIRPSLKVYTGSDPVILTGRMAQERAIKLVHGPSVVVISSHGFADREQNEPVVEAFGRAAWRGIIFAEDPASFASASTPKAKRAAGVLGQVRHPLAYCGLALAGANVAHDPLSGPEEDGILTGLEVTGIDLRGTELVVLSACETAVGHVESSEGVLGLRYAFQAAGAKSTVASLWKVPDIETKELMEDFFQNLANGQSKPDALRNAQLKIVQAGQTNGMVPHPYFWAAFTLVGER